jgi:hypothetical protein
MGLNRRVVKIKHEPQVVDPKGGAQFAGAVGKLPIDGAAARFAQAPARQANEDEGCGRADRLTKGAGSR